MSTIQVNPEALEVLLLRKRPLNLLTEAFIAWGEVATTFRFPDSDRKFVEDIIRSSASGELDCCVNLQVHSITTTINVEAYNKEDLLISENNSSSEVKTREYGLRELTRVIEALLQDLKKQPLFRKESDVEVLITAYINLTASLRYRFHFKTKVITSRVKRGSILANKARRKVCRQFAGQIREWIGKTAGEIVEEHS